MEFRVVAMPVRFNLGNTFSEPGHVECSHGPHVPHTCISNGATDGGEGVRNAPWVPKCTNRAPLAYISVVLFLWFSVGCRFFPFFGSFSECFTVASFYQIVG